MVDGRPGARVEGRPKSGPDLRGRVLKPLPPPTFRSTLIFPLSISPRQKKSKISASRKLQLKVWTRLEKAPRCSEGRSLKLRAGLRIVLGGHGLEWCVLGRGGPPTPTPRYGRNNGC